MGRRWYIFLMFCMLACADVSNNSAKYLHQKRPAVTPERFAPGIISKEGESEFGSVFSADGTEFFYAVDTDGKAEIRYTSLVNDQWSSPVTIITHEQYSYNDPFLSPDEEALYFISDSPLSGEGDKKDYDIWYSLKEENGWSAPINAGPVINSAGNEYYVSFTEDSTLYFSSNKAAEEGREHNYDIYYSTQVNSVFQPPVRLSDSVNTSAYEADVFVAPDASYLIFCSVRRQGLGEGDLYISFKNKQGDWALAENMQALINSQNHELCPFVTRDGKYFFYTSNQDIYWVDAAVLQRYQ